MYMGMCVCVGGGDALCNYLQQRMMCLEVSVSSIERSTIFSQPPQHSTGGLPVVTTLQLGFCGVLLVKYQPALCAIREV